MSEHTPTTMGIDISDRMSTVCVLAGDGEVMEESRFRSTRAGLGRYLEHRTPMRVVLEVGTHSPWMSRQIEELGHEVFVANPRQLRLIYQSDRKCDAVDAEALARLGRVDPKLLRPIRHRAADTQLARAQLRVRDMLVAARTRFILSVRGMAKSMGEVIPRASAESFHVGVPGAVSAPVWQVVEPLVEAVGGLTAKIKGCDAALEELSLTRYPETAALRQISGVGPITALAFVTTIEDPHRFARNRSVGAYLGLCPRRDQSGASDPSLRITKAGDPYLRRLLVGCAHYILGPFGPDSDLRRWGLAYAGRGTNSKKRAVVAVARKLAVLLLSLWKTGETYEPTRHAAAA